MTLRGKLIEGRWSDLVVRALPDGEILNSSGDDGYSGCVSIVARLDDGRWLHYLWSYGSCSGCDSWEDAPEEEVITEIQKGAAIMEAAHFAGYLVAARDSGASWLAWDSYAYPQTVGLSVEDLVEVVTGVCP